MAYRVEIQGMEGVKAQMARLSRGLSDMSEPMRKIGLYLERENTVRFFEQRSPAGVPWKPSRRAMRDNGLTLVDSGRLSQSISAEPPSRDSVEIGISPPLDYASKHQFGEDGMPVREFLGIAPDEADEVEDILRDYIRRLI